MNNLEKSILAGIYFPSTAVLKQDLLDHQSGKRKRFLFDAISEVDAISLLQCNYSKYVDSVMASKLPQTQTGRAKLHAYIPKIRKHIPLSTLTGTGMLRALPTGLYNKWKRYYPTLSYSNPKHRHLFDAHTIFMYYFYYAPPRDLGQEEWDMFLSEPIKWGSWSNCYIPAISCAMQRNYKTVITLDFLQKINIEPDSRWIFSFYKLLRSHTADVIRNVRISNDVFEMTRMIYCAEALKGTTVSEIRMKRLEYVKGELGYG